MDFTNSLGAATTSSFHAASDSLAGRLNLEWARLQADPGVGETVARWACEDPALRGLSSLALIEQAKGGPVDARVDGIVYAIVRRAITPGPDAALAARVALQLMLPKTLVIARAHRRLLVDREEREQLAVFCMYEAIRSHPARVTHHVPPHLAWTAFRAMRREVLSQTREVPVDWADRLSARVGDPHPSEELARLLAWATDQKVISKVDAELLAARYGTEGTSKGTWKSVGDLAELSNRTGLAPEAIRQRCSRARRRLARAVTASFDNSPSASGARP
jgi:hypothetical protein